MPSAGLSITRKFGGFSLFVVALLFLVCAVVVVHVAGMRADADRLLEETRERLLIGHMARVMDEVRLELATSEPGTEHDVLLALLVDVEARLVEVGEAGDDPSRAEHQEAEDVVSVELASDAAALHAAIAAGGDAAALAGWRQQAGRLLHRIRILDAEMVEEVERADRDLARRARSTRNLMLAMVLVATLGLVGALALVYRTVVAPLRTLRDGAERVGRGELDHRMPLASRDEIGELARAFNRMAARIETAQEDLQARVEQRTREFLRAARLADLGIFAAGLAHEINTPLASIVSCSEGLARRVAQGSAGEADVTESIDIVCQEAYRARDITSRLLALARQDPGDVGSVELDLVKHQLCTVLEHLLRTRSLTLAVDFPPGVAVEANAVELVQILVNLVRNAMDASAPGDVIDVRARLDGGRLALEVEDHGTGIAPEDTERVFEPFFTTKDPGKGTGLGLALTAALVGSRGGTIRVESRLGEGSTFHVDLPRAWRAA